MLSKFSTRFTSRFSPNLRKIFSNTVWLFADRVVQLGLSLVVGVVVARYLGPEQFGFLNYVLAFVSLFGAFTTLGLDSIVIRDLIRNPLFKNEILGTTFALKFLGGLVALVLAVISLYIANPNQPLAVWMAGILSLATIFQTANTIDFWFQSQVQSKYTVWCRNLAYLFMCIVRIGLIYLKAPLIAFVCAFSVEAGLAALGQFIVYRLQGNSIRAWHYSFSRAKQLLRESWPLMIFTIIIGIYMRTDQVMLGLMLDSTSVGVYSAATKLAEMWYFVPGSIVSSVFPSIVQAKEISQQLYYRRLQKLFYIMAGIGYLAAISITLFSNQIVTLLYGQKYGGAAPILTIYVWAGIFVSLGVARGPWIISEGLTQFPALTGVFGAIANVLLNYFLIPKIGGIGSAIATVIAQILSTYLANALYPKTRPIFMIQTKALLMIDPVKYFVQRLGFGKNRIKRSK